MITLFSHLFTLICLSLSHARQRSALTCPCCICVQPCVTVIRSSFYVVNVHRKGRYTRRCNYVKIFFLYYTQCNYLLNICVCILLYVNKISKPEDLRNVVFILIAFCKSLPVTEKIN